MPSRSASRRLRQTTSGSLNGSWNVLSGTGDFAKLHGSGDFSVVFTGHLSGVETLTGGIHFD